jgi:hypothetical protein
LHFHKQFFLFLQIPMPTYFRSNSGPIVLPNFISYFGFSSKGDLRRVSKVQGPTNSSNLIGRKLQIGSKAFRRWSKTNKRQTEAEPTWHLFWTENLKKLLKGELLFWKSKNQARDQGTVRLKDSICFKSVQIGS